MLRLLYLAIGTWFLRVAHYFISKSVKDYQAGLMPEEDHKENVGILYHIVSGPHSRWQYDGDEDDISESLNYYLVVKVGVKDSPELEECHMWFEDEESANEIVNHFKNSIEPCEFFIWR